MSQPVLRVTRRLSFLFSPALLRVHHKNRISGRQCVEYTWNRNLNMYRGFGVARHPVHGGDHGGLSSVYALDVGAWNSPYYKNVPGRRPAFFLNSGLIILAEGMSVKPKNDVLGFSCRLLHNLPNYVGRNYQ
jgi:hypothetical protein